MTTIKEINVCGTDCNACNHYHDTCSGCKETNGTPFWISTIKIDVCKIYHCCNHIKHLKHCGNCHDLPCEYYELQDPAKSNEENQKAFLEQMKNLSEMEGIHLFN